MHDEIDLSIARRKLHQLQLEEGDLGAAYWLSIVQLLERSNEFRNRALAAETKIQKIGRLCE